MQKVESFDLDHDLVKAPYVRKAGRIEVVAETQKAIISKFDLRFTQPNEAFMPMEALHSLEHLLAFLMRDHTKDLVDISPMGCRTGFYAIFVGDKDAAEVEKILRSSLWDVLKAQEVPGASRKCCGNYKAHHLIGAQQIARTFLEHEPEDLLQVF